MILKINFQPIQVKLKKVSVDFLAFFASVLLIINTLNLIFKRTLADTFSLISWFTDMLKGQKRTHCVRQNGQTVSVFTPLNKLILCGLYFLCPLLSACFWLLFV